MAAQPPPFSYAPLGYQQGAPGTHALRGPRAGFGQRLGASLIDGLILGVPQFALFMLLGAWVDTHRLPDGQDPPATGLGLFLIILTLVWPVAGSIAYLTIFEGGGRGQTIGKRALGIRVIGRRTSGRLGYGKAFGRSLARIISSALCFFGYLWMLWDDEKQTWHDKMVGSVVVPVAAYPVGAAQAPLQQTQAQAPQAWAWLNQPQGAPPVYAPPTYTPPQMPLMPVIQAGWYDDPERPGAKRWWDGRAWGMRDIEYPLQGG